MLEAENVYHSCGLIAVILCNDPWFRISRDEVQQAMGQWLGVHRYDIGVELFPPQRFLLLLSSPDLWDRALSCNDDVGIGRAKLQLLPWTRLVGAKAASLPFWVRLCMEGVPHHELQQSTLRQLLPRGSILEGFDPRLRNDKETACCCVIVWSRNPDEFALEGILRLEELHNRPRARDLSASLAMRFFFMSIR
jgi:hypothetical protein